MNESLIAAVSNLESIAVALGNYQVPESGTTCEEYLQRLHYVAQFLNQLITGAE